MQIHVVKAGQTLFGIAQLYSTPINTIIEANELPNPNQLVIGQTLVIPIVGQYYFVQPGDSLWSIGQKFNINYVELAKINQISLDIPLRINLRIYIPPMPKREAEFNAYIEPRGQTVKPELEQAARKTAPLLTYLAPFSFQVKRDGSLKEPLLNDFPTIAKQNNVTLMMVLTNLEEDQFND